MMLIGILWTALAPVSLILAAALLAWLLRKKGARWAVPLAVAAVATPVAIFWLLDRSEFVQVCEREAKPVIYRHATADGIFLNSGTSNSFGMRYLHDEGFRWVEAPSIYRRDAWVRYERSANGSITTTDIPALSARYEVWEVFTQPYRHTGLSRTLVVDRATGEVLAKAGSATFDGGRVNVVLGAWGTRSCPSAMDSAAAFSDFYHLAKNTLR